VTRWKEPGNGKTEKHSCENVFITSSIFLNLQGSFEELENVKNNCKEGCVSICQIKNKKKVENKFS
jgi:hypothetical protein